jgi:hypothetical protein
MAIVTRQITGPIETPEHEVVTTGLMRVKLLYPIAEGDIFVAPFKLEYNITDGDLPITCKLATPGWYQFKIFDLVDERVWTFQVMVYPNAGSSISIAELWLLSRLEDGPDTDIPPEQIDLSLFGSDGAAEDEVLTATGDGGTEWRIVSGTGLGDMLKSVYDTDDDGTVDLAERATVADDSDLLGGISADGYQEKLDPALNEGTVLTWDVADTEYTPNENFQIAADGSIEIGGLVLTGPWFGNVFVMNQVYYLVDAETHVLVAQQADVELRVPDPALNEGRVIEIKKASDDGFVVTITVVNNAPIDGQSTYELTFKYEAITLLAANDEWWIY